MRTVAVRHPGHVSTKTLGLLSIALCVALLAAVIAVIVARSRTRSNDIRIVRETQDERALRMGWTELGAVARADPPSPTPSESLPESLVSKMPAQSALMSTVPAAPATASPTAPETAPAAPIASAPPSATASAAPSAPPSPPQTVTVVRALNDDTTEEPCGHSFCRGGLVCCNASCGTCVEPGQKCSQFVCGMSLSLEGVPSRAEHVQHG